MDGALTAALYIECTDELPSKLENLYNRGTIERIYYNNPCQLLRHRSVGPHENPTK